MSHHGKLPLTRRAKISPRVRWCLRFRRMIVPRLGTTMRRCFGLPRIRLTLPLSGRHITSNISNINWLLTTRRACSEASVLSVEGRFLSLTKGKNIRLHKSASIPAAAIKNTTEKVLPCKYLQTARLTAIIISL